MNTIYLHNIKCHGCARSITDKLNAIDGVSQASVSVEEGSISFESDEQVLAHVKEVMSKAGYPESDPTLMQTAKSYVSCMAGRLKS